MPSTLAPTLPDRTRHALAALAVCTLVFSADPVAGDEIVTDRPDQTESSVVVPPGYVQVEMGWTFTQDVEDERIDRHELPGTLVRIGVYERLELRLGWSGYVDERVQAGGDSDRNEGVGDGEVGTKIYLWPERGLRPEAAVLGGISLPFGADNLTSERVDPNVRASLSHEISDRLSLGYNLGWEWETEEDEDGDRHTGSSFIYTVATGLALTERLGTFVEFFGTIPLSTEGSPAHSFNGGFTYLLADNVQLDTAAGVGLSDDAEDWFVGAGVSVRWPD